MPARDIINKMDLTWNEFLEETWELDYGKRLRTFIDEEYAKGICYPPKELMFNAFQKCPLTKTKVVLIGQDPYPNPGQAMGLCFSVPKGVALPPSLRNIYKEMELEGLGPVDQSSGDLTYLAEQGVLLLNAYLSVRAGIPGSHQCREYDLFMRDVMRTLDSLSQPIVFLFWGGFARKFMKYSTNPAHLNLTANHPSPLSANRGGFFGCNHFVLANRYLVSKGLAPIDWAK